MLASRLLRNTTSFSGRTGSQLVLKVCSVSSSADPLPQGTGGEADVKPFSAIPGPKGLPILGNVRELSANFSKLHLYLNQCFKEYGDIFKLKLLQGKNIAVIKDPNATMEFILRAEGKYPVRDNDFSAKNRWLYENKTNIPLPIGLCEGQEWKERRVAMGKQATPRSVQAYSSAFTEIFQRFTNYIESAKDENEVISDIASPIKLLFVELSAKFVFGSDIKVVTDCSEEYQEFVRAISSLIGIFTRVMTELPLFKLYDNKLSQEFQRAVERMKQEYGDETWTSYFIGQPGKDN